MSRTRIAKRRPFGQAKGKGEATWTDEGQKRGHLDETIYKIKKGIKRKPPQQLKRRRQPISPASQVSHGTTISGVITTHGLLE